MGFGAFWLLRPAKAEKTEAENTNAESTKVPVHVTVVKPEELSNTLEITGNIIPEQSVALKTEATGRITSLNFTEGSRVEKGKHLLTINNKELKAQLREARHQKTFLQKSLNRKQKLLAENGISQETFDKAKTALERQKAKIDRLEAQMDKTTIHAPFSGTLGLKDVHVGSYVSPATPVVQLVKRKPVKIAFSVPGQYASLIRKGRSFTFRPSNQDTTLQATIHAIEPVIDEGTRQLRVRARYPNHNQLLKPGGFVDIKMPLTTEPQALMVPAIAVIPELNGKKLYVYRNGKTYPRSIETAQRVGDRVQVVRGLKPGDTVISKGIQKVKKGTRVEIKAFTP